MASGIEIERKYLLRALPVIPDAWQRLELEQGYLNAEHVCASDDPDAVTHVCEGRIRRTVRSDGSVTCTHTIKRGMGLVREETERDLTEDQFLQLWPLTQGMRLRKTRWVWHEDELQWAIDRFYAVDLVLAEVEMPRKDCAIHMPEFLAAVLEREVTDVLEYVNSEIARRIGAGQ